MGLSTDPCWSSSYGCENMFDLLTELDLDMMASFEKDLPLCLQNCTDQACSCMLQNSEKSAVISPEDSPPPSPCYLNSFFDPQIFDSLDVTDPAFDSNSSNSSLETDDLSLLAAMDTELLAMPSVEQFCPTNNADEHYVRPSSFLRSTSLSSLDSTLSMMPNTSDTSLGGDQCGTVNVNSWLELVACNTSAGNIFNPAYEHEKARSTPCSPDNHWQSFDTDMYCERTLPDLGRCFFADADGSLTEDLSQRISHKATKSSDELGCLVANKSNKAIVHEGLFPQLSRATDDKDKGPNFFYMKHGKRLHTDKKTDSINTHGSHNSEKLTETDMEMLKSVLKESIKKQEKVLMMLLMEHSQSILEANVVEENTTIEDDSKSLDVFKNQTQTNLEENSSVAVDRRVSSDDSGLKTKRRRRVHKYRQKPNKCYHLWDFMRDLLEGNIFPNEPCMEWVCKETSEFRITNTKVFSKLWGSVKKSKKMDYEKLSRTIRYYCKLNILEKVQDKRLQFKFGTGKMWKKI